MQMLTEDKIMKLKSGTDVRGVAVQTETENIELTDEAVEKICIAFSKWIKKKENKENIKISVGHDSRISANRIKNAAVNAFKKEGLTVYDFGLASTPSMFMSIVLDIQADCALESSMVNWTF